LTKKLAPTAQPVTTKNLAFCQGILPGASAPDKFARSNARETPDKLQLQTAQ